MWRASGQASTATFWSDFENELRNLDYAVGEDRVCASRFGVPQYRRRSVLLALRGESPSALASDLQVPTANPDAPTLSARGAIDHLPVLATGGESDDVSNHVCRNLTEVNRRRLMSVKPGEANWGFAETPFGGPVPSLPSPTCRQRREGFRGRVYPDASGPSGTNIDDEIP